MELLPLQNFSQFITRTASGHSVTILLILSVLLLCGVVNTVGDTPEIILKKFSEGVFDIPYSTNSISICNYIMFDWND